MKGVSLSCEQVLARRVSSIYHIVTMDTSVNPSRSGRNRYCEVHIHQKLIIFHDRVIWKHVVLVKGADHSVQELGGVVCKFTQTGMEPGPSSNIRAPFLSQLAFGLPDLMSNSQQHPESGRHRSSIQGATTVVWRTKTSIVSRDPFQGLSGP